jgi:hypothetical protein
MFACMHAGVKNGGKAFVGIIIPCSTPGSPTAWDASAARPLRTWAEWARWLADSVMSSIQAVSTEQHVSLCSWIAFWRWSSRRPHVQVRHNGLAVWECRAALHQVRRHRCPWLQSPTCVSLKCARAHREQGLWIARYGWQRPHCARAVACRWRIVRLCEAARRRERSDVAGGIQLC